MKTKHNTITDNGNGVIYIETESGQTFGLVNAFKIIDQDGLTFPEGVDVLENHFDIDQDWDNESIIVNVDDKKIILTFDSAELEKKDRI